MRTFSIQTLGCKVNQYESEQIATLLRARGLVQVSAPAGDIRVVNSCSVTVQAASKSRQTVRRTVSLPTLTQGESRTVSVRSGPARSGSSSEHAEVHSRTIITGCWATSDRSHAAAMTGVDAVITHHDDVAAELDRLLSIWETPTAQSTAHGTSSMDVDPGCVLEPPAANSVEPSPKSRADDGWMNQAGTLAADLDDNNRPRATQNVNEKRGGTTSLPLLDQHQSGHQRAFLKVQDGCDAHCTYCIIPKLRPRLWSKPTDDAVDEAKRLVDAGHIELVLTGIFLGAYGQRTALRRRQDRATAPVAELIDALCTRVPGLRRLRLSSLEPGDLTGDLLASLSAHEQVVPHFHLPLQSGSDLILHRMNRQYTRDDYLRMLDHVRDAFDRPALTTDIIVGFPGETATEFERTLEVVERARFIHVHAFSFSPRPGTAAARWSRDFVRGPVVNERIDELKRRADRHSHVFRQGFVGEEVELLVERPHAEDANQRHGRCERYFSVFFEGDTAREGDFVRVRIDRATPHRTIGTLR